MAKHRKRYIRNPALSYFPFHNSIRNVLREETDFGAKERAKLAAKIIDSLVALCYRERHAPLTERSFAKRKPRTHAE